MIQNLRYAYGVSSKGTLTSLCARSPRLTCYCAECFVRHGGPGRVSVSTWYRHNPGESISLAYMPPRRQAPRQPSPPPRAPREDDGEDDGEGSAAGQDDGEGEGNAAGQDDDGTGSGDDEDGDDKDD
eukprot:m.136987 g.136987  ORF g.136987 m.136987 type:complete len:127 (-) comp9555_c0_seq12:46-426(-)